jgi:hypothetical protein
MTMANARAVPAFQDVRVITAAGRSPFCGIGWKHVVLSRRHISGKLDARDLRRSLQRRPGA